MKVKQENEVVIGDEPTLNLYSKFFKRLIDLGVSSISLIILCIPFLVIACFIKADSKGPVFFKQVRMGKNNVPFNIMGQVCLAYFVMWYFLSIPAFYICDKIRLGS